jgi:hypothetical protein
MNRRKSAAGGFALLTGVVETYAGFASSAPEIVRLFVASLGFVLAVDSLACLYGVNIAFVASTFVSVVFGVSAWVGWGGASTDLQLAAMAMAAVNAVFSVYGYRTSTTISEQANPMNLPVFG